MTDARYKPFSCGSQMGDWETHNCQNCHIQGYYRDQDRCTDWVWRCDLQRAIGEAYIGDGSVSEDIARRMGAIGNETAYGWRCGELVTIEPIEQYAKRFQLPVRRLAPLWKRLRRAAEFAYVQWNPWWRPPVDIYGVPGRIPLLLSWRIAWGIHHDDTAVVRCRSCKRPMMPEVRR